MLLWIGFAVLTAAVIGAIVRPLLRTSASEASSVEADLAVYRDQLAELVADQKRGLIGSAEAEAARAEIARRLLARAGRSGQDRGQSVATARPPAAITAWMLAALVPVVSLALYLGVGSPGLPARPHAERVSTPAVQASLAKLVAQVEARLREHPQDGQGWDVIAPVYLRMQRYADAAEAFGRSMRILGETPKRLAGFAEAKVLAADGIVGEEARRAYEKVLAAEPERHDARFWLAVAKEQDGDLRAAIAGYAALLERAPADAAWRTAVAERKGELDKRLARDEEPGKGGAPADASETTAGTTSPIRASEAPSSPQIEPARLAFVTQMVDGLAARLKNNGNDLDGWLRLARAYSVLGRKPDAAAALSEARRNFATDAASLAQIEATARTLGLGS